MCFYVDSSYYVVTFAILADLITSPSPLPTHTHTHTHTATIVEFSDPVYWLPESQHITHAAITRSGFISGVTEVTCIRKPGNATSESEITSHNHADFLAGSGPAVVTFHENQTRGCKSVCGCMSV